ncbi:MAG TPA: M48 family metallopeptidase [Magnetospirillum sp.]|nr:M48 family metallopeptidase [Magnetospirillum sp.]
MCNRLFHWLSAALVALPLAGCGSSTGIGVNLVPQAQVDEEGVRAWQQLRAEVPASANGEYQARGRQVADRVLQGAGENPAAWEVVVFKSSEINAFALPGNKIGIYEGMMALADSDDELAAVIGHEIGHNRAHHAAQRMSTDAAAQLGVDVLSAVLGGGNTQMAAALLGAGAQYGIVLPYSRNQELQADQLGLHYMARAGYDPRAALALWRKMEKAAGQGPPSFLSTHPATGERIQGLEAQMPQAEQEYRAARARG